MLFSLVSILIASTLISKHCAEASALSAANASSGICGNDLYHRPQHSIAATRIVTVVDIKTSQDEWKARLKRLRTEFVVVRLNIVVDESLSSALGRDNDTIYKFVRDLLFSTQLYFERDEMFRVVKFNFVVYNVIHSTQKYSADQDIRTILGAFSIGPDVDTRLADINILLIYKNLWSINYNSRVQSEKVTKVLGLAHTGVFCNANAPYKTLVIQATSLGSAITLAHELAHSFNVQHDSTDKVDCSGDHMMAASLDTNHYTWSHCSVNMVRDYLAQTDIFQCLTDSVRSAAVVPFRPEFNFTPLHNIRAVEPLPGVSSTKLEQCLYALGRGSAAASDISIKERLIYSHDDCIELLCSLENGKVEIRVGPAAPGSPCILGYDQNFRTRVGFCYMNNCVQSIQ